MEDRYEGRTILYPKIFRQTSRGRALLAKMNLAEASSAYLAQPFRELDGRAPGIGYHRCSQVAELRGLSIRLGKLDAFALKRL